MLSKYSAGRLAAWTFGLGLLAASAAHAAGPSTQFTIGGEVDKAAAWGLADLQKLPSVTQDVSFSSGSGQQTHTYTGATLWDVVNQAGVKTSSAKNDILTKYVLATGTDGYRVAYSLGELNPSFGNRPDLVAYAETVNGVSGPLGSDGFARTTAPGDVKGGRYLSNLASLDVQGIGPAATGTGGTSSSFTVTGDVTNATSFDLAALKALPTMTQTVGTSVYTGVSFWDLLNSTVGLATTSAKNDVLSMLVTATGSDGYRAVFSLGELNPGFGNQPDMIAYEVDGKPLTDNGFARLVVPNDVKGGRMVSNLVNLNVFHAVAPVPEPGTWALMLGGLAIVGWTARRRKASSAA